MVSVLKASGVKEPFSEEKLIRSIVRAGIPSELHDRVIAHVREKLYDGITTQEIYKHITEFLSKSSHPYTVARYSMKDAIMQLGPTGYPFEDFVARILTAEGFTTTVRVILQGKCVTHEVDVVAQKEGTKEMVEAKFHHAPGNHTQVHVSLYTRARFEDLREGNGLTGAWLITNTKITTDALNYAKCSGLKVMGWSYPEGGSLRELIEKFGLIPVTALTTLSTAQKQLLLSHQITLCSDLCNNRQGLAFLQLPKEQEERVFAEASFACNHTQVKAPDSV